MTTGINDMIRFIKNFSMVPPIPKSKESVCKTYSPHFHVKIKLYISYNLMLFKIHINDLSCPVPEWSGFYTFEVSVKYIIILVRV